MTMKNPVAKLSVVAAIVVVAGIAGVVMWTHTGSGIALADVLTQVQQITAYMFQTTVTVSNKAPTGKHVENLEGTILFARDYGMKMTIDTTDPNTGKTTRNETYLLPQEKTELTLMPATKQYRRRELNDALIERTRQQNCDPGSVLKQILNGPYKSLGRSVIDGAEVEGFQVTGSRGLGGMSRQMTVRAWIDPTTHHVVRLEMDTEIGGIMQIHSVAHNFQWDCPADAETFKPVIPPDYTILPGFKEREAKDEEKAIAGLKLCADLIGRYPMKLDLMTSVWAMTALENKDNPAFDPSVEEDEALPLGERIKRMQERAAKAAEQREGLSPEERDKKLRERVEKYIDEEPEPSEKEKVKKMQEQVDKHAEEHGGLSPQEKLKMMKELIDKDVEDEAKSWRKEEVKREQEQSKEIREQTEETADKLKPLHDTVIFYMMLTPQKRDPAYYGKTVTPKDADKVLMRWKVSDGQYRVIFGSLHAETVDAQTLAELEKDLPK